MKKTLLNYYPYFFLTAGLFFFSCSKNETSKPTITKKPFKASFNIYEPFYGTIRKFPTDTIVTYRALFETTEFYDSCQWKVGDDPRIRTTNSFNLTFPMAESGHTIPVTLIAWKNGKTDTVSKSFTLMGLKGTSDERGTLFTVQPNYIGKFKGSFQDEPNHEFEVNIVNFGEYPYPTNGAFFWEFRIFNLPEGCGGTYNGTSPCKVDDISPYHYSYDFQATYQAFYVNDGADIGCCPPAVMYGYMDTANSKKIIIEYSQLKNISITQVDTVLKRKFIGYKQ